MLALLLSFDEGALLPCPLSHVIGTGCLYMTLQQLLISVGKQTIDTGLFNCLLSCMNYYPNLLGYELVS